MSLPRQSRKTADANTNVIAAKLLAWYDRHHRELPWRVTPAEYAGGIRPDPYRVWLSEIMLQQTTVEAVKPYFRAFTERWPDIAALAAAEPDDIMKAWAGLGYYSRARNLRKCAELVARTHDGCFPDRVEELAKLPGIGAYTAGAIAAIAFGRRAAVVDGNVERVVARLEAIATPLPDAKPEIRAVVETLVPDERPGDFAQAMMDLGATICTPVKPACVLCPWMDVCASRRRGDAQTFPRKAPKREGRLRRGAAFVVVRADGCVLLRSRPPKGLLGGMTEVPTTEWSHDFDDGTALEHAPRLSRATPTWQRLPGVVTHVFTHFPLELVVYTATLPRSTAEPDGARWGSIDALADEALPNLMRKVLGHALGDSVPRRRS
jgi:A/G-specific adenine glycosylase